jgi:hypothetical protein
MNMRAVALGVVNLPGRFSAPAMAAARRRSMSRYIEGFETQHCGRTGRSACRQRVPVTVQWVVLMVSWLRFDEVRRPAVSRRCGAITVAPVKTRSRVAFRYSCARRCSGSAPADAAAVSVGDLPGASATSCGPASVGRDMVAPPGSGGPGPGAEAVFRAGV